MTLLHNPEKGLLFKVTAEMRMLAKVWMMKFLTRI